MAKTTNYGFNVYTDEELAQLPLVKQWREKLDGHGKTEKSNFEILDEKLKEIADNMGGVDEDEVIRIIEENTSGLDAMETQEVGDMSVGTSTNYDETSDSEIPTTKAVATMVAGAGASGGKLYYHKILLMSSNQLVNIYFWTTKEIEIDTTIDGVGNALISIDNFRNMFLGIISYGTSSSISDTYIINGLSYWTSSSIYFAVHNKIGVDSNYGVSINSITWKVIEI